MVEEDKGVTVAVEGDALVIRVPIATLAFAVKHDPKLEVYDETLDEFFTPEVTDEKVWANEVCTSLLKSEEEDGLNRIQVMLDAAALDAIESGAEGIETADYSRDRARAMRDFPPEVEL
jgi:hypothetical protein